MSKAEDLARLRTENRALKDENARLKEECARLRGAIPGMEPIDRDVSDMGPMADAPLYHVYSWSPEPAAARAKTTQVHLVLELGSSSALGKVSVALRLKTPRALDEIVGALLQHRKDVWPEWQGPPA